MKVFKVADLHSLIKQVITGKITYTRMVEIMNEMTVEAYSKAENLPISGVSDWVAASKMTPEFDGNYLCYINKLQDCGNIWRYYKTVHLDQAKWVLEQGEQVIYWTSKAFPFHVSPEPPCC
jgi:hypothetical protein